MHLDAASMARVRLAVSPAYETIKWLRLTGIGARHGVFGDPGAAARFALRDPDVAMLARYLAGTSSYVPDVLSPKPLAGTAQQTWAQQLAQMRATPAETVAEQFAECAEPLSPQVRTAVERGTFARRAAGALDTFWRWAMAGTWPALHDRMQADLAVRMATMATQGVGAVLGTLHPTMAWTGTSIRLHRVSEEEHFFAGTELVLAPSVLAWPKLAVQLDDPEAAVLTYPVYGLGIRPAGGNGTALTRLLGGTRAALLRDLDVPRTTTDLSSRHNLAPATVSYHLRVLHGSGLITRQRDRRSVLYRRTEQGDALHG